MDLPITGTNPPDRRDPHDWAVVLAGGQGRRLAHLTLTEGGVSVPKQFCSLGHGASLIHATLQRAAAVAPPERTLATVTESHAGWWRTLYGSLPAQNLLVQPEQRGTGIGILHPLLEILRRDSAASVLILPSDHYFSDEAAIARGLRAAMKLTRRYPHQVLLLGFEPEQHDADLGYIVPGATRTDELFTVSRFIEKPDASHLRALADAGALSNSFILAANAHGLLELFERRCPRVVAQLRRFAGAASEPAAQREMARAFHEIPTLDFSQEIITPDISALRVLRLPRCGWSDLGTPARLDRVLRQHAAAIDAVPWAPPEVRGRVDLAARWRRHQGNCASSVSSLRS